MNARADVEVAVVGAGVMGLAAARALAQAGRNVVLCEQFALGHDRGSSHGGSRIVRLSYPDERWVRLAQESYPGWRALEAELGRPLLELHGTLDLGDWAPNRTALVACGIPFEVLDAAEIRRRFGIGIEAGESGLFQAEGGIVRADPALEALLESARTAGVQVREGVRIDSVEANGDLVSLGGLQARCAVVTAGAWAPGLVGVDATPDARDGVVLRARRAGALGDRREGGRRTTLRAARPVRRPQGRLAPDRARDRSRRAG